MREKVIDIALIVTLIVVAFGITWTLLTLNRGNSRPPDSPPVTQRETPPGTQITPIPVDPAQQGRATEDRSQVDGQVDVGRGPATETREQASPGAVQQVEVAEPEPVPPGAVRLERIGFSFVTGGAGACGIVLEPWRHVAVSRELLAAYGCGAEVAITLDDEKAGRSQFQAVVADTMNPSFSRTVNIYVGEDEPALEYGVTSGTLRP
jgi:3D (Asp-Asp-Asp) domain-containing protein